MSENARILVVDDDISIRTLCREVLELQDFEIVEAENGKMALKIMQTTSFSLVLSDIMMPDMGGLELASEIRVKYPDTLVILITGHGSIDLAKDAIQRGAFDFITKPFSMVELSQTVGRALEFRKKQLSVLPSPELKDLYNLTVNINISKHSRQAFLETLVQALEHTFRGDSARIYLASTPGESSVTRICEFGKEDLLSENDWKSFSQKALNVEGGILAGEYTDLPLPENTEVSSLMAAAIPSPDGNLGVCMVARSSIPASFTIRDLKLLGLFAAQAGNQLMNYRLTSNLRGHADRLSQVNILAGDFSSSLDTKQVLSSIVKGLRTMIPFDLFGVFLSGKDMLPLSYTMVRSDIPDKILNSDLRKLLEKTQEPLTVGQYLDSGIRDSFACARVADWESAPNLEILDLSRFGSLNGMVVLANWSHEKILFKDSSYLSILVRHAAMALSNAYLFETSETNYTQAIFALASAVDAKDPYTSDHSRNVAAYVMTIAAHLHLPVREIKLLHHAALLHDIGKIGIPESILNKQGKLTSEEFDIIKMHPVTGYRILRPVTAFGSFINTVKCHHERYDGKGYPCGLAKENIPHHARILAVADCFDAMTSDRVYRKAPGVEYALNEIRKNSGSQFDPEIAGTFLDVLMTRTPESIISEYISIGVNRFSFS